MKFAGPEEAENLGGGKDLRLIQIRLATPSFQKLIPARQEENVRYGLIDPAAMCVSNRACSTVDYQRPKLPDRASCLPPFYINR